MYEESICSLCIAVNHKNTGTPFLFRVADVFDGRLNPFALDNASKYEYENIDLIYNPKVPAEGSIGFWDWYSEDARRQRSYSNNMYRWIEYIKLDGVTNTSDVIAQLHAGIEGIDSAHDYLFECKQINERTAYCLFVRGTDFQRSLNSSSIKSDIYVLNMYEISQYDVREIKTWHLPNFCKQYYSYFELGEIVRKEYVRNIDLTIKMLIQSRINTYTPSNKKSDKVAVRNFLNLIPDSPLVDVLAEKLVCDKVTAQYYVDTFLETCESYFACEDYDARIMQRLIDSDTGIARLFMNQVREEWERQNKDTLENANAQLTAIQEKISVLQNTVEKLETEKTTKEEKINSLSRRYKDIQQTATAIEAGIRERIGLATQDVANFFVEYALFLPQKSMVVSDSKANVISVGKILSENPETINELNVLWDCLQDNLIASGVERDRSKSLAAYLLATYFTRSPLILAGYGADLIFDALSATLINKSTHQIFDPKFVNDQNLNSFSDGEIVVLHNAFDMTLLRRIIAEKPSLYVSLISTTAEELAIEPHGIYNYALPLFAEYFVTAQKKDHVEGFISHVNFVPEQNRNKTFLPKGVLPAFAQKQSKRLVMTTAQILPDITDFDLFLLQVLPTMLAIGKCDDLVELISTAKLSDSEKSQLLCLMGEHDE